MKNTILLLTLVALSIPAFSQIPVGTSTIGGGFSLSHTKYKSPNKDEQTNNSFSFTPSYGYFVVDNLCIGVALSFSNTSNSTESVSGTDWKSTNRGFGIGPFARYYVPISNKFYAFGHVGYSRNWSKYETRYTDLPNSKTTTKFVHYDLGLAAGISYFLNPHVALEASLGYTHTKDRDRDPSVDNYKANRIGLDAGIRVFLRKD